MTLLVGGEVGLKLRRLRVSRSCGQSKWAKSWQRGESEKRPAMEVRV